MGHPDPVRRAGLLAISGTFDQLTNFVVFGQWIFYILTTDIRVTFDASGFRTPFDLTARLAIRWFRCCSSWSALWLLVNTLRTAPLEAVTGLSLISSGVPFYLYYRRGARRQEKAPTEKGYEFAEPI